MTGRWVLPSTMDLPPQRHSYPKGFEIERLESFTHMKSNRLSNRFRGNNLSDLDKSSKKDEVGHLLVFQFLQGKLRARQAHLFDFYSLSRSDQTAVIENESGLSLHIFPVEIVGTL